MNDRWPECPHLFADAMIYDVVKNKRKVSVIKRKKEKNRPPITNKREATHGRVLGPP